MTRPTALIDMLTDVWASLDSLLATLTESQWKTMTECPGWTAVSYTHLTLPTILRV